VRNVRSLTLVASLAAVFILSNTVNSSAGTIGQPVVVNMSHSSNATPVPQQAQAVPPNCIMQACGTLYCWHMKDASNVTPGH
jgi:hypothetical protein